MTVQLSRRLRLKIKTIRLAKQWAPSVLRRRLWDREYSSGKWDYLDDGDSASPIALIAKYAHGGRILDLGCGTTRSLNLAPDAYSHYVGVDISADAIARARSIGRPHSDFVVSDVVAYRPAGRFDLVLLREVLYYLPTSAVAKLVLRAAGWLNDRGVVVVIIWHTGMYARTAEAVRRCGLPVIEEFVHEPGAVTLVLGRSRTSANASDDESGARE